MSHGGRVERVRFGLLVTSDRVLRGETEDRVTPLVEAMVRDAGHVLTRRLVAGNDLYTIMRDVLILVTDANVDAVIVTGGTGPRPRDVSVDAVSRIADRALPGFGEEFRRRSLQRIGINAILSRAAAFLVAGKPVFVLPGSPDAVETGLGIILEVIGHLVYEARRG